MDIRKLEDGIVTSGVGGYLEDYALIILVPFGTKDVPLEVYKMAIYFSNVHRITFACEDYSTGLMEAIKEFDEHYSKGIL